jgi:hypothetical protein
MILSDAWRVMIPYNAWRAPIPSDGSNITLF